MTLGLVNGVQVVGEADNGDTAYEAAISLRPDVVIMDMSMPGLSGLDAMHFIHKKVPAMPVVILTAHADDAIEREALASGAAAFLTKGGGLQAIVDELTAVVTDDGFGQVGDASSPA